MILVFSNHIICFVTILSDFNDTALIAFPVAAKRLKLAASGNVATAATTSGNVATADFVRRSNRKQKVRGEKEFLVSSDMLLRDLKVKVGSIHSRQIFAKRGPNSRFVVEAKT